MTKDFPCSAFVGMHQPLIEDICWGDCSNPVILMEILLNMRNACLCCQRRCDMDVTIGNTCGSFLVTMNFTYVLSLGTEARAITHKPP